MLHPAVIADLLEHEANVARERHGQRFASLEVAGTDVFCVIDGTNKGTVILRLDGARYDAEPFSVTVIRPDGSIAPQEEWPGTLAQGIHPGLQRPFVCIAGTFEYHTYLGHTEDTWDAHRHQIHLVDLLDHLLKKAGK